MISPRRLVPLLWFLAAGTLPAQAPTPMMPAAVFSDERAARIAERYKAMLAANPVEGLALDRLWKSYEDAGATNRLIEEYRLAASVPATATTASLVYGHLLKKAGRLDDAAAAYDRAASLDPASPLPTLARGALALARAQPAEAARQFEAALGQLPAGDRRRADLLIKTGDAWLAAGQPLKAAGSWEQTIAFAPGDLGMHRRLAENYEKNGLPERAIGHYEYIEAHADPAGRATALRELGRLHELRGEFEPARDALERGLALTARDNWLYGELQKRLILLYQRAGRTPELEARWRQAVADAPRDLGGYQRLESLAEAQGDAGGERLWLEKIVALSPRDRDSLLKLARLLADNGEREAAAALYDKLLQPQSGNLELILARAELDVQMGRPEAAAARIEARLAQNPTDESIANPALEFFLAHHLDAASEKYLRDQTARQPTATDPSVALAKFLFSKHRPEEARQVLRDLSVQAGDAGTRASRWTAIANVYKEQNLNNDALDAWQQAASAQPGATAPLLAASELLLIRGDTEAASKSLESALDAMPAGPERVEVEHRLFQVLQSSAARNGNDPTGETSGWTRAVPGGSGLAAPVELTLGKSRSVRDPAAVGAPADGLLGRYLDGLRKLAADQPTAEHFLRLARWESWSGETLEAGAAAEKVIALDPANIPAREFLVGIATDLHQNDLAEQRLREIMALEPARQSACLRRIAGLKLEENDLDAALAIYEELRAAAPGSADALSDLALAQQRADRWYDALANWERAYALPGLTPAQRTDLRRSLLAAYERLEQFPRAAEILQAGVDGQPELAARGELFHDLVAFCGKHNLSAWLEKQYQTRLAALPNDYFTLVALAEVTKAAGRDREGYRLLGRAYFSSPDPAASLRTLAEAAETLGENDEAVVHQRRLTTLPGQATAENLEKLADLQSAALDPDAAARTWEQIVAKFPRDPGSLERGAGFFEGNGRVGRARELFQQVIALDANEPGRLFHLARLDLDAGDTADARTLLEDLLACTDPEKPGDPLLPPPELDFSPAAVSGLIAGMASHRARDLGLLAPGAPAESDARHLRLDAVRELARLVLAGSSDDRRRWLDRWRGAAAAGQRSEPLAAFYFAGEKTLTMDLVTAWIKSRPDDDQVRNTFLATGLRLGEYERLAQWAWRDADLTHKAERGQWLLGALEQYLNGGGKPGPGIVAGLFPPEVRLRETLWEAASTAFAERHWYAQAAELGQRVFALMPSNRSEYALKIAEWELYDGKADAARTVLRDAVEEDRGESFDVGGNAVFAALRAYDLLLPASERPGFAESYLRRMRDRGETVHATLAAVLLHALGGDEPAARRDLDDLMAMRMLSTVMGGGTPDARRWNYVLNNGAQLLAWNLDSLAAYYWRQSLKEVSSFDRQDGNATNFQTEIRGRLLGAQLAVASDPQQAREYVEAFLRAGPGWDVVAAEAAQLLAASQWPAAARLYETLCGSRPNNAEDWRNLFVAYESAGDQAALERGFAFLLANRTPLPAGLNRFELFTRMATLREAGGDIAGACRLLEHARLEMPGVQPILMQLAQTQERAGRWDDAASTWTEAVPLDPAGGARLSLAAVEEHRGRLDQAVTLLNDALRSTPEPSRTNAAARLARLYVSAHRIDDARALGTSLLQEGPATALPAVAGILGESGERVFARELLTAAVRRTHDAPLRYEEQRVLTEQFPGPADDLTDFMREMRRLEMFARADEGLRNAFAIERYRLARQRGADAWLETELKREWDDSKGDLSAGEKLANLYIETGREEDLRGVVAAIDHHADLPEQTLHALEERLVQTRHGAMALPMLDRLRLRFPQNDLYAQDEARALSQAGRRGEAGAVLDTLDDSSVFRDDLVGQAGVVFLELGDKARARQKFEAVERYDLPAAHHPLIALHLARMAQDERRFPEARRWLRLAYRNPTCVDLAPLVDFLGAAGQLESQSARREMLGGDLPLPFLRRAQLLTAIGDRLLAAGQAADACRWAESYPELLAGAPGLLAESRRGAGPSDLPALIATVESAVSQTDPPAPQLDRALSMLYVQWAGRDSVDTDAALNHLARAHELEPDNFDTAQLLVAVCLARHQQDRAAAVLARFIGPDALPSERSRAQQMLGSLSPGTAPSETRG